MQEGEEKRVHKEEENRKSECGEYQMMQGMMYFQMVREGHR